MAKYKGLIWLCASLIALGIGFAILQVFFYYAIASFTAPEPSVANTAKDLLVAMGLQTMQLNVKAFIYIGILVSLLNTLLWIVMKQPELFKKAFLVGLDSGLILSIVILVRLSVILVERSHLILASGLAIGLIAAAAFSFASVKLHLLVKDKSLEFESCFVAGVFILLVVNFLRLGYFEQYRFENYQLMLTFSLAPLLVAGFLGYIHNYARLHGGPRMLLLERIIVIIVLAAGIFFSSGSVKRFRLVSRTLSRTDSFQRASFQSRSSKEMPNVILIVWDTVRRDHLSLYNYERKTTPFLDSLARNAVVFERAYSTAPNTVPSHASIFTGLYSSQNNCHYENPKLELGLTTLAEMMVERGYLAMGITNNRSLNHFNGFSQGFDIYKVNYEFGNFTGDTIYLAFFDFFFPEARRDSGATETKLIFKNWMLAAKKTGQPFFLFINYMEAHQPYPRTQRAFHFFQNPEQAYRIYEHKGLFWDYFMCAGGVSESTRNSIIKWYDGAVYYLDFKLSQLYETLESQGLRDHTIIIVTSDHGESFGEHNIYGHMVGLYEHSLAVPLVISWPGHLKPMRTSRITSLRELPEIITTLVDNRYPRQFSEPCPECEIFAENFRPLYYISKLKKTCRGKDFSRLDRRQKAVISANYKFIWDSRGDHQFFSLAADPAENRNLFSEQNENLLQMKKKMANFILASQAYNASSTPQIDPETLEALKAIGYIR